MESIHDPNRSAHASPVDMHVHVVGTGSSGSGCELKLRGWRHLLAGFMCQQLKLPRKALQQDLETLYVELLLKHLRSSSIRRAVILAQDHVYDDHGRPLEDASLFYVPNDYILKLSREHPELLPAISIHPARPDAIEELNCCLDLGAVMMKCLPNCQNINCNDRRFTRFWERMADAKLPLLAHTGGENTLPVTHSGYETPKTLTLPLECGVTVIAGHVGTRTSPFATDYFDVFAEMLGRFPNLYGDTSALVLPIRSARLRECLRAPVLDRLVHGSDFPVPVQGIWSWFRGVIRWKDYVRCRRLDNPIERDYQLKLAMGFPPEHFTRILSLLRIQDDRNPQRMGAAPGEAR